MKHNFLFVIGTMRKGGAERVMANIANSFKNDNVYIVTLLDSGVEYKLNKNVRIIDLSRKKHSNTMNVFFWIKKLRKLIKELRPDSILSFIGRVNMITILANYGLNYKMIVSERNDPANDGRGRLVLKLTNFLYRKADSIIFQTEYAKNCFSEKLYDKSIIIENPVNVKIYDTNKNDSSDKVVCVGRLEKQKNHELLIKAFKNIHNYFPDLKLEIYGDGSLKDFLNTMIIELEAQNYIFLMGKVDDIYSKINGSKLFVLSSLYEGFSNALLEAMYLHIPCLSSDCAGSVDLIQDGLNGYLFNNGSCLDLEKKLVLALSNDNKEIIMNANKTLKKYDPLIIEKKWQDILI